MALYIVYVIIPLSKGAPFIPTQEANISHLLEILDLQNTDTAVDLGSGDGRILIDIAKRGITCDGYELKTDLAERSRQLLTELALSDKAKVFNENLMNANLSKYNVVIVFQVPYIMNKLSKKLLRELKPGARIASYCFKIPHLRLEKEKYGWFVYQI